MPRLLLTGITGLIGKSVLQEVLRRDTEYQISALVRPGTIPERYQAFSTQLEVVKLDLGDAQGLQDYLAQNRFDTVMHIAALRGGRKASREEFLAANLRSTQQLAEHCLRQGSRLIYCSSVGVFGAIPDELPANRETEYKPDNLYHYTKIESEKYINQAVLKGLKAAILRPSITYGRGDRGFPFQLVKMVSQRRFPLINKRVWLHLCHVETISRAFVWLLGHNFQPGLALNVADREPVQLLDLVNFISRQLNRENYSSLLKLDQIFFRWGEALARTLKNELWQSRFQLISRSWFYYVADTYQLMDLPETFTIPGLQITIDDFTGR